MGHNEDRLEEIKENLKVYKKILENLDKAIADVSRGPGIMDTSNRDFSSSIDVMHHLRMCFEVTQAEYFRLDEKERKLLYMSKAKVRD